LPAEHDALAKAIELSRVGRFFIVGEVDRVAACAERLDDVKQGKETELQSSDGGDRKDWKDCEDARRGQVCVPRRIRSR
jgi:hypothetical protein